MSNLIFRSMLSAVLAGSISSIPLTARAETTPAQAAIQTKLADGTFVAVNETAYTLTIQCQQKDATFSIASNAVFATAAKKRVKVATWKAGDLADWRKGDAILVTYKEIDSKPVATFIQNRTLGKEQVVHHIWGSLVAVDEAAKTVTVADKTVQKDLTFSFDPQAVLTTSDGKKIECANWKVGDLAGWKKGDNVEVSYKDTGRKLIASSFANRKEAKEKMVHQVFAPLVSINEAAKTFTVKQEGKELTFQGTWQPGSLAGWKSGDKILIYYVEEGVAREFSNQTNKAH